MNLNLTKAVSILSRMGVPVDFNSSKATIIGTGIHLGQKGNSITIESKTLPLMDFQFGLQTFNKEYFIQCINQAMTTEASEKARIIMEGIYNAVIASTLNLNNIYIEDHTKNSTAVLLPTSTTLSITVFQGPVSQAAVKSTMILPLTNDPVRYVEIIKSLL